MKPKLLIAVVAAITLNIAKTAISAIIFESATLGPTGIPIEQVFGGTVAGSNVLASNYVGARFEVDETSTVTAIGGHFIRAFAEESFFGAVVKLSDASDFPNSGDLATPDVLAIANLSFPHPSDEVFSDISATLMPGWYAVIFGSGLFQASGWGGTVNNGEEIGAPSYIFWQPGEGWFNLADLGFPGLGNLRLVVEGQVVPEPNTAILCAFATSLFFFCKQRTGRTFS